MELKPVLVGPNPIAIDLTEWETSLGDGGFAEARGSASDPAHVLKRMNESVLRTDAIGKMKQLTAHAKVVGKRLDDILANAPKPFVKRVCQSLRDTLSTHIGWDNDHIYLYQRKATGASLRQWLSQEPPAWNDRVMIAKNLASAMVALRRCAVVHLDCSPDNVFVERDRWMNVTLIDLDGCGVLPPGSDDDAPEDTWALAPMTLGRPDELRPIWFPCDPEWQTPMSGNFKYAERWCVINEVWRILSWGGTSLFWLDGSFTDLFGAYDELREMYRGRTAGASLSHQEKRDLLVECQRETRRKIQGLLARARRAPISIEEFELGSTIPAPDQQFLAEFAKLTLLAFLDPRDQHFKNDTFKGSMPTAHWIQDQLINLRIGPR